MARQKVTLDDNLRTLIRVSRQRAKLTQIKAAEKTGISEVWWSQIETGIADVALMDTVVSMAITVNVPVRAMRKIGHNDIADGMEQQLDWFGSEAY